MKEQIKQFGALIKKTIVVALLLGVTVFGIGYTANVIGFVPDGNGQLKPIVAKLAEYPKIHEEGIQEGLKEGKALGYQRGLEDGKEAGMRSVAQMPWYKRVLNPLNKD